jgi:sigma-B regulation protein RsbU (phosphoserine phosphatase)
MDSILVLGNPAEKLRRFLEKMGYLLIETSAGQTVPEILNTQIVDLLLLDGKTELEHFDLTEMLKSDERTSSIPIIYLAKENEDTPEQQLLQSDSTEVIPFPHSVGTVASKIATRLRLRKMAGATEQTASLAEINAALRDHNERINKELEEARTIQKSLLPESLPQSNQYEFAVVYQPLQEVGGDWYYVKQEESGIITALVSDVTGHGLAAAFIGSMTKLALGASSHQSPGVLLAEMNRLMTPQIPAGRFVTMSAYMFEPDSKRLRFARAGHPPGLLLHRKSNTVEQLSTDGFAIGFFEDSQYDETETTLEEGDLIVMYSDGIIEAQNRDNKMYGTDSFSDALLSTDPKDSAEKCLSTVMEHFNEFRDERIIKDDLTLLLLKCIA